ncbi:hypothetical protein ACFX14_002395 [Malus domestica]
MSCSDNLSQGESHHLTSSKTISSSSLQLHYLLMPFMEALYAHPFMLVNLNLITMRQRQQHMRCVREPTGNEYERSEGVAGLQQLRLLLCMAQRHLIIFSSAWHSNNSDHPLHCIMIVFAFKADCHDISERKKTRRGERQGIWRIRKMQCSSGQKHSGRARQRRQLQDARYSSKENQNDTQSHYATPQRSRKQFLALHGNITIEGKS